MSKCHCSVKIKNLRVKRGGNIILDNVTLTANHGETLALIGKNGAGKTTFLKAILGGVDYSGTIGFFDSNGIKISNPKIGYVPQRLGFDKNTPITVLDFLCANLTNFPVWFGHKSKQRKKALEILERVGAQNHINKSIGRLSGGELQRVLLASALEPRPDILILDEPVSAVDRKGTSTFYSIIESMREEYHMPIILVSHDLGHVVKYANSYALINHTVLEIDKAENLSKSQKVQEIFGMDLTGGDKIWK